MPVATRVAPVENDVSCVINVPRERLYGAWHRYVSVDVLSRVAIVQCSFLNAAGVDTLNEDQSTVSDANRACNVGQFRPSNQL